MKFTQPLLSLAGVCIGWSAVSAGLIPNLSTLRSVSSAARDIPQRAGVHGGGSGGWKSTDSLAAMVDEPMVSAGSSFSSQRSALSTTGTHTDMHTDMDMDLASTMEALRQLQGPRRIDSPPPSPSSHRRFSGSPDSIKSSHPSSPSTPSRFPASPPIAVPPKYRTSTTSYGYKTATTIERGLKRAGWVVDKQRRVNPGPL